MAKRTKEAELQEIGMDIMALSLKLAEKVREQNSLLSGIVDDGVFVDHIDRMGFSTSSR